MLRLYNTLSRKIEVFKPLKKGQIKIYSCGPTVYDYAHLGNLRAYVFIDFLKRYFRYQGYRIKHAMNITDVDDKTIRESQKQKKSLKQFTDFYLRAFVKDLKTLNIEPPDIMPRVSRHISAIIDLIKILLKKGFAYKTGDGSVYFKISKFSSYGELAQLEKQNLETGAGGRLREEDEYSKENTNDFVLWKAWKPDDGKIFWQTELGKGRPGWHIECSAMSMKYLGPNFDIHSGGVDLIFPHHTNEIAQSEAATGKKFVNCWLHNAHLIVEGQKMSKSLGNSYTLHDLQTRNLEPLLLRLILLKTHYRQILDFSFNNFQEAKSVAAKFLNSLIELKNIENLAKNDINISVIIADCRRKLETALDDDLNISLAFTETFAFLNEINKLNSILNRRQARAIQNFIKEIDSIFGFVGPLFQQCQNKEKRLLKDKTIKVLLNQRTEFRAAKNYAAADRIRRELLKKGLAVDDTPRGQQIRLNDLDL